MLGRFEDLDVFGLFILEGVIGDCGNLFGTQHDVVPFSIVCRANHSQASRVSI